MEERTDKNGNLEVNVKADEVKDFEPAPENVPMDQPEGFVPTKNNMTSDEPNPTPDAAPPRAAVEASDNVEANPPQIDGSADPAPEQADAYDEEDVPAALERETQDGSGLENDDEANLPESDFQSFATDDVEEKE